MNTLNEMNFNQILFSNVFRVNSFNSNVVNNLDDYPGHNTGVGHNNRCNDSNHRMVEKKL